MKQRSKHILSGLAGMAGMAGTVWLGLFATLSARQHRLIFNPIRVKEVERPRSASHRTRSIVLRSKDGTRLCGWLLTPKAPGPHPAAIYFGGRSEEVSWVARDAGTMCPDMTVLVMNYRGYGDSDGIPAERHLVEDGQMLFDWLAEHRRVDPGRIAVIGRSLGSGVALQVAAQRPAAAAVLITPYDSILAIAKRRFKTIPVSLVLRHRFESIKHASQVVGPVLVLRAENDSVIPRSHTDLLVSKLASVQVDQTVPGSDHFNIPYLADTQQRIAGFLHARLFSAEQKVPAISSLLTLIGQ
ncbi:alpha/beta hydrolase [Noviherbaspirillum sp. Root189]|uniref:alpha/beta hydrolase n=1 Tax=Noviherbaspirillum sp. Root189 TaxID=1736487 RepID=UPI00070BE074|nr:alpha/beta fold hydrolase [Noviherbaspirillum sp. Root189]KRB68019.1 alpha/beta hydrolase [Noviherbaspirillum sp. Root189]